MDWIADQIAIGNYRDAAAAKQPIDAILCLTGCCDERREDMEVLKVPLNDGAGNDPRHVDEAVDFLSDMVDAGARILVHCHAGRSRSVAIVARHLMAHDGLTRSASLARIQASRDIYLSDGIDELLSLR